MKQVFTLCSARAFFDIPAVRSCWRRAVSSQQFYNKMYNNKYNVIMQKILNYLLMAATVCGISLAAASCSSNDDNPATPDLNVAQKIIGKWIVTDKNGQPLPTNKKAVYSFVSSTKAFVSMSITTHPEMGELWYDEIENDVVIDGNKVTLTGHPDKKTTVTNVMNITAINNKEFTADFETTTIINGKVVDDEKMVMRFTKLTADYAEPILGLWECEGLIGDETYNDGNDRLEFLSDGTYRFYHKDDAGQWQAVTTREFQDYFVDGTLLATRWKNKGEDELREWWEIASLDGNEMVWTALRQNDDGTTVQQKMTWKKIDLNIPEKIIGKWMIADRDGQPMQTNKKRVFTFVSTTKAYMSASLSAHPEVGTFWGVHLEGDVVISGNKIIVTAQADENKTVVHDFIITDITDKQFSAKHEVTHTIDNKVVLSIEGEVRYVKVTADYSDAIVGTWEGRCTSEGSIFDDGQEHRWEYKADGTYVYYVKDGNNWVPYATNTLNEYFVDGNLLCTRWIDNGVENREWWEITITDGKMNWTALRENEDGTTFTATFEMKKVD